MAETTVNTQIHVHNTPEDIYASFVRVFGEHSGSDDNAIKWVAFSSDDVTVTMFKSKEATS